MLIEGQIPVFRLTQHGFWTAHGRTGVDQFGRRKGCTTFLTLVAIGTFCVAVRTFARDVAVGQEGVCLFVVILFALLFYKLTLIVKCAEEVWSGLLMYLWSGAAKEVERNAKAFERFANNLVVTVHHLLGGATFLTCTNGDGHTMFVRTADEKHFALLESEVTHVYICWYVDAS